ncbi:AraC family transcriptional regulator [Streptomyces sp. B6B3]|uniref:AraC family transcriptional regulator n=1 Tax=Streptomyces sp. B6B3 TaxID=3153570 RepID=UPI00325EC9D0
MLKEELSHAWDFTVADDFVAWWDDIARTICPVDARRGDDEFHVETRLLEIGNVRVWPTTVRPEGPGRASVWPPRPHRVRPPEWCVAEPAGGGCAGGDEASHDRYERYVIDTSPPWDRVPWRLRGIGLEVPAKLLPRFAEGTGAPAAGGAADRPLARVLPGREGIGAVLSQFLTSLIRQADCLRSRDVVHLEAVLTELLAATLAHSVEVGERPPVEHRSRVLTRRVRAHIEEHLGDPELSPRTVAAAHHISVSYLHRLFRADGTTVAAWIRERRLEAARRDLADPAQWAVPVHGIAARWGFTHHASFTRAFHAAYGRSPREYRFSGDGEEGGGEGRGGPSQAGSGIGG